MEFLPGESKVAVVTMRNPTTVAFDYSAELYMGTDLALMASNNFHLESDESKDISLPVTMPSVIGTYPVYIGVFSGGKSIGLYKAVEDVVIVAPIPFIFSNVSASMVGFTDAPAYLTIIFNCTITNQGTSRATNRINVMSKSRYDRTYDGGWTDWKILREGSFDLTLDPGQSYNFKWDGNVGNKGPTIARRTQLCMWLEDEAGNKSGEGCVARS